MSGHRRRITAMQALLVGTPVSRCPEYVDIHREFESVYEGRRIRNLRNRHLLQVVHSCRALDTCLKAVLIQDHQLAPNGMGSALYQLRDHGIRRTGRHLAESLRRTHNASVARIRNHYLHSAGAYPGNSTQVDSLLTSMQSCLQDVIALL